jgi:elongation factor Ts
MANYNRRRREAARELTGSGMMDCKKAPRSSPTADVEKPSSCCASRARRTSASVPSAHEQRPGRRRRGRDGRTRLRDRLSSPERDFQALADQILQVALDQKPADLEALRAAKLGDGTVEDAVQALSARIGEKLELKRYITIDGPVGALPAPPLDGPAARDRRAGLLRGR